MIAWLLRQGAKPGRVLLFVLIVAPASMCAGMAAGQTIGEWIFR